MSDANRPEGREGSESPTGDTTEPTGVINLNETQAIPGQIPAQAPQQSPQAPASGWFDGAGTPDNPIEGPGVPSRADALWGSDRDEAAAEQAHREAAAQAQAAANADPHAPASSPTVGGAFGTAPGGPGTGTHNPFAPPGSAPVNVPATSVADPLMPHGGGAYDAAANPGSGGVPAGPISGGPKRRGGGGRRTGFWAAIAAVCLLAGLIGGYGGQLLANRLSAGSTLPEPGPGTTARPAGSVANIAATVLPSVVTIKVRGDQGNGTGSGFVIDNKGHVLTNNHVIAAASSGGQIEAVLSNGDVAKATIVGRDVSYDLAVIKLDRTDLKPLIMGASKDVVVGDPVIAVGAPLGLEQTVTTGIVSALDRPVTPGQGDESSFINAIQTDAAINPGNSGGPLLDMNGKVVGVNSAIARVPGTSGGTGGSIGLGFAIPSDQARRTADQLIATGKATHPAIGVKVNRTSTDEGATVSDTADGVTAGGPAAKAGVKPGDIIIGVDDKRIRTADQLIVTIRARNVGDEVTLKIKRGGQDVQLRMKLEAAPDTN